MPKQDLNSANPNACKQEKHIALDDGEHRTSNWLNNVSATGDFYCDPNATIFPTDSISGIPSGWTRRALADYPN